MSQRIEAGSTARLRTKFLSGCAGVAIGGALLAAGTVTAAARTLEHGALAPDTAPVASDRIIVADLDDTLSSFVDQVVQAFTDDPEEDDEDDDDEDGDDPDDEDDGDEADEDDDEDDDDDDRDDDDGDSGGGSDDSDD